VALTVLNYLDWCSVSVNGGSGSTAASQTVCVADGTVDLTAKPASAAFQIPSDWYGTSGDTGSGDPGTDTGGAEGTSAATVTATGTKMCVSVCCPFVGGTGCPATGNQCP